MTTGQDPFADGAAEQARRQQETASFADKVRRVDAAWLREPPPARRWLVSYQDDVEGSGEDRKRRVRGFIARGEMHLLVGEGGVGKGHVVCQLATALAGAAPVTSDGVPLTDTFPSVLGFDVHPLKDDEKILLLVGEDDAHEMHARIYAAAKAEKLDDKQAARVADRLRWRSYKGEATTLVDLSDDHKAVQAPEMVELLRYLDEEGPFALVVVDPYSRFIAIEENANTLQHQAAATLEAIGKRSNHPAILLVGHVGKPEKEQAQTGRPLTQHDARGASAIVNAVRVCHAMAPLVSPVVVDGDGKEAPPGPTARKIIEHSVRLACVKNNLGAKGQEKRLSWTPDGGLYVEDEKAKQERRKRQWRGGIPVHAAKKPPVRTGADDDVTAGDDA